MGCHIRLNFLVSYFIQNPAYFHPDCWGKGLQYFVTNFFHPSIVGLSFVTHFVSYSLCEICWQCSWWKYNPSTIFSPASCQYRAGTACCLGRGWGGDLTWTCDRLNDHTSSQWIMLRCCLSLAYTDKELLNCNLPQRPALYHGGLDGP